VAHIHIAQFLLEAEDYEQASAEAEKAMETLAPARLLGPLGLAHQVKGRVALALGELELAHRELTEAQTLLEPSGRPQNVTENLCDLAACAQDQGDLDQMEAYLTRAESLAAALGPKLHEAIIEQAQTIRSRA